MDTFVNLYAKLIHNDPLFHCTKDNKLTQSPQLQDFEGIREYNI